RGGGGERAWEDGPGRGDAGPPAAARLRQELVDGCGDRLVKVVLLEVQLERDRVRVPVREQPPAAQVAEVFLEPPQCPRAVRAELEDVTVEFGRLVADPAPLGGEGR